MQSVQWEWLRRSESVSVSGWQSDLGEENSDCASVSERRFDSFMDRRFQATIDEHRGCFDDEMIRLRMIHDIHHKRHKNGGAMTYVTVRSQ